MEQQNQFKCKGNCLQCLPAQRQYCASQHAYSNMKVLDQLMNLVLSIDKKIEAIQNNEASVFDPNGEKSEIPTFPNDKAQEEAGAENKASK